MQTATDLRYPKRLIEVDLPIARISAHARREKSIRHGHISTLHIWWARRPLAACRAVILASLWPDPAPAEDEVPCPPAFLEAARKWMVQWAERCANKASAESSPRIVAIRNDAKVLVDPLKVREALLDFIADFANWDRSADKDYLEISRALTQAAHEALGGKPGTRPLVVDPFAGGGSIPLEALRVGADAYASDLNPIPVLLNKVVLEYIPKYGQHLADEVRKWGQWVKEQAEKELAEFYPKDPDGAMPIAYLWARTIRCEGPGCGAEVPTIRSLWLSKKGEQSVRLKRIIDLRNKRLDFEVAPAPNARDVEPGTIKLGSVTCPLCQYTTRVERVREQLGSRRGGAADARLLCAISTKSGTAQKIYRVPGLHHTSAANKAAQKVRLLHFKGDSGGLSPVPDEPTPRDGSGSLGGGYRTRKYGIFEYGDFFSPRQQLALTTFLRNIQAISSKINAATTENNDLSLAITTCLAMALDRCVDYWSSFAILAGDFVAHTFGRHSISMIWDFAEVNPFADASGNWSGAVEWVSKVLEEHNLSPAGSAQTHQASANRHPLPDDTASLLCTDPPYYDSVPYSELSDFFYVWLKRSIGNMYPSLFTGKLTPKSSECIVNLVAETEDGSIKDKTFFESTMQAALADGRRFTRPDGISVVVFAHKSTAGWEAILASMIAAGWVMTASWPIDTERPGRLRAQNSAALASSIHIVCRPRENADGSVRTDSVGEWRDVLEELPVRIQAWMKRLKQENVVGADAIFSCLGPALEIFSRYSRVEKSSGDIVPLREYLEHVWATVSHEAVKMIFEGAESESLEPDARLTTMWLWTLGAGQAEEATDNEENDEGAADEEDNPGSKKAAGFALEFDAARMIAVGLGIHLDKSADIVQVKGETARLLSIAERASYLFGKGTEAISVATNARKKKEQLSLGLDAADAAESATPRGDRFGALQMGKPGATVLDRLHQAMILFGAGRGEALRAFLVDDGHGRDERFWRLAQSLAALYPRGTEERRWVEGVLSRKKSLGL